MTGTPRMPAAWKAPLSQHLQAIARTRALMRALIASTVETLCADLSLEAPEWCRGVSRLDRPWFVSGVENLKASALVESPSRYRMRNVFVLANFLERV